MCCVLKYTVCKETLDVVHYWFEIQDNHILILVSLCFEFLNWKFELEIKNWNFFIIFYLQCSCNVATEESNFAQVCMYILIY